MAIYSSGQYYGIPKDLIFSFPVITKNGKYTVVENLPITDYYRQKLDAGVKELIEERNAVEHLLK
jgi:malate/lactate dehydrogenase